MEKYYKFKKPNVEISLVVERNRKKPDIWEYDVSKPSLDISNFLGGVDEYGYYNDCNDDFIPSLYEFVTNYNETWKNLKMKKEHQSISHMDGRKMSTYDVSIEIKNGVGIVNYSPFDQSDVEHEKNMWGRFTIKKVDMLKFLNDWSEKEQFDMVDYEVKKFKFNKEELNGTITFDEPYGMSYSLQINDVHGTKLFKHFHQICDGNIFFEDMIGKFIESNTDFDYIRGYVESIEFKKGEGIVTYEYQIYDHVLDGGQTNYLTVKIKPKDVLKFFNTVCEELECLVHKNYKTGSKYLPFSNLETGNVYTKK